MARKKKEKFIKFKSVNCSALNVRSEPSKESQSIKVLVKGYTVECDKNFKDKDWEHVKTASGIDGYCMKMFLDSTDPDICDGNEEVLNGEES